MGRFYGIHGSYSLGRYLTDRQSAEDVIVTTYSDLETNTEKTRSLHKGKVGRGKTRTGVNNQRIRLGKNEQEH